jgi:hypothetical protein
LWKQAQSPGFVQMQNRAGDRHDPFHFPDDFSRNAQALSCNCCCSINS